MHPRLSGWDFVKKNLSFLTDFLSGDTLDSRIDVGQGIKVEHGKFNKKKIWQKFEVFCNEKTGENYVSAF